MTYMSLCARRACLFLADRCRKTPLSPHAVSLTNSSTACTAIHQVRTNSHTTSNNPHLFRPDSFASGAALAVYEYHGGGSSSQQRPAGQSLSFSIESKRSGWPKPLSQEAMGNVTEFQVNDGSMSHASLWPNCNDIARHNESVAPRPDCVRIERNGDLSSHPNS